MRHYRYNRNVPSSADVSGRSIVFSSTSRVYELDPKDPIVANMVAEGWLVEIPAPLKAKTTPEKREPASTTKSTRNKNSEK